MPSLLRLAAVTALAGALAACSGGVGPSPSPSPTEGVRPSPSPAPTDRAPGAPEPPIETPEEAVAAVAAEYPEFEGYGPRDPGLIGQSHFVDVIGDDDGFVLTFHAGSGDCPAGCIDFSIAKFRVHLDGTVERLCEWRTGEVAAGTPC